MTGALEATQATPTVAAAAIATVTESWVADAADKDAIAQLCRRFGYDPAGVTAVNMTAGTRVGGVTGITVQITRRA